MRIRSLLRALPIPLLLLAAAPLPADAFCGFYVGGAGAKLFNNATLVVLMRDGTRTVLAMQNNYQGPPEHFALVVPVPVVLQKENVKTLPREVFDRVDQLAAPRLVEYWEQDPCAPEPKYEMEMPKGAARAAAPSAAGGGKDLGVKIEAQFTVGEYEVVILSASDSLGLDTWLRLNKYAIPDGAEAALKPYVAQGMKFFVAKVDTAKVKFEKGQAMLSPLRFHYDSESFSLPVRLGLLNSSGTQDLLVHILARERYEVANRQNITIPTNLDVDEKARDQFPAMYAALFDLTQETHPGAAITEYAWQATSCDPCPGPPLGGNDFATLGGDALPSLQTAADPAPPVPVAPAPGRPGFARPGGRWMGGSPAAQFTLTRLHLRYRKDGLADDLVFNAAKPITGGREVWKAPGKLEHGSEPGGMNNFQGRYAIRHPWKGPIACANPRRGNWGGPPAGTGGQGTKAARDLAFAPRGGVELASLVRENVPEINLLTKASPGGPSSSLPDPIGAAPPRSTGCGGCTAGSTSAAPSIGILALGALLLGRRRRR
jgi:MYXO-CTERM domain-containing protein